VKRQGSALPASSEAAGTATLALGLPGFVVLTAAEYGGELELLIETTESVTGCPECGVVAVVHDRRPRWVRDLPAGGRPVTLVWFTRVWRCAEPAGGQP
jgi:transposase